MYDLINLTSCFYVDLPFRPYSLVTNYLILRSVYFLNGSVRLQILADWVNLYGTVFVDVCTQTCCSNVVDMSIMPFVEFLKEFYPLLTAIYCNAPDLVKHCLLNLVFSIDTI